MKLDVSIQGCVVNFVGNIASEADHFLLLYHNVLV